MALKSYRKLLKRIMSRGEHVSQRATLVSTQRKPQCYSLFGSQLRFRSSSGFPFINERHIGFNLVVGELLWFLSGSTDVKDLRRRGVKFWDPWVKDDQTDLGPIYGRQWRDYRTYYAEDGQTRPYSVDQIKQLEADLRALEEDLCHPSARRLLLLSYNAADRFLTEAPSGCHTLAQFSVRGDGERLDCQVYMRSCDVFLGLPYNIGCYALLQHMLAHTHGFSPGDLIFSFGDVHLYENHWDQAVQLLNEPWRKFPRLLIKSHYRSVLDYTKEDFELLNYESGPRLSGEPAV